ncbi:hypothetical protein [Proteus hauseri]|uniref:hypothetical protein n=1 Tax=Proteus hauseri TaxID=183417 RepID=UPI0032DA2F69
MEPIYIKAYTNRIEIRDLHTKKEASAQRDFSHSRMLIGDFPPAVDAIIIGIERINIKPTSFF